MDNLLYVPNFVKLELTVTDVAFYLNCSSAKVYGLIHKGAIPAYKQGREFRIYTENLMRYIQSNAHYRS
jgi:excisionase family DNA binding protein